MVRVAYLAAGAAAAGFAVFVALAQSQVIAVPYFTPAVLEIQGLQDTYGVNGSANFTATVKGYGSNCHLLQAELLYLDGSEGERMAYYRKADDCRFMVITHGPYNLTRSFDYGGQNVFGREGDYKLQVQFEDLIDGTKASETRDLQVR
ncbi:MAG: hypothetical protein QXJ74_09905 [Nitrososphaera sp.]